MEKKSKKSLRPKSTSRPKSLKKVDKSLINRDDVYGMSNNTLKKGKNTKANKAKKKKNCC